MDVGANGGVDPRIEFEVDGVDGLLVWLMRLFRCFKTLHMPYPYVDFKCTNTSSFCKTIMYDPSSFDVLVFNSRNVSHNVSYNLSFKVSSWKFDYG
jgi:hypothetical protein